MTEEAQLPSLSAQSEARVSADRRGGLGQLVSLLRRGGSWPELSGVAYLSVIVVLVICGNAIAQVRLNVWQGAFYDALGQRDVSLFLHELLVFVSIVAALLVLAVSQTWLTEMIKVRLREWLTNDLLKQWLMPKRAYLLMFAGEIGVNPDQRIHEDARHLTELISDLGVGLLQASLLLVCFVGVLWLLSAQVVFSLDQKHFTIPGYMVWCALAYALAGSWLTWRVGQPLIGLNADRYAREAELRFALVRISESAEGIALYGGESDERRIIAPTLNHVLAVMAQLAGGLARLTWVTSGYGWLAIVAPVLAAAPGYFSGSLSLGGLMMVVGAFLQVQQALRWFVDNFSRIADWRATLLRVMSFRDTLATVERLHSASGHISISTNATGRLVLDNVAVFLPEGRAALQEKHVEIQPGERILLLGEPHAGKTTMFLALAGLWSWGSGTLRLPERNSMSFLPQRPYLPLGTLRAAACYPAEAGRFGDPAIRAALERVGLRRLTSMLDIEQRWDRALEMDEQQCLAFARLLLHKPTWVLIDDAMSALDDEHRLEILSIFEHELAGTALIMTARTPGRDGFFGRTVHLTRESGNPLERAATPSTPISERGSRPNRRSRQSAVI